MLPWNLPFCILCSVVGLFTKLLKSSYQKDKSLTKTETEKKYCQKLKEKKKMQVALKTNFHCNQRNTENESLGQQEKYTVPEC